MAVLRADVFQQAVLRHTRFYLQQIKIAHQYFHGQQAQSGLAVFDEHWSQIYAAFEGLERPAAGPESLELCNEYVHFGIDLVMLRRPAVEHITWLTRGLQAARQLGDSQNELDYLNRLGQTCLISKSLDLSLQYHQQAVTLARAIGDEKQEANALTGLGRVTSLYPERADDAREYFRTASTMLRRLDDLSALGWCLQSFGALEERTGRLDAAETYLQEAVAIFEKLGDQRLRATTLRRLSSVSERRGDYETSLVQVQQALHISQELNDIEVITGCLLTMGLIKDLQGDSAAAYTLFEEALTYAYKRGNKLNIGVALINLGWIATNLGDYEAARRYHQESVDLYRSLNHRNRVAAALSNLGFTQIQLGWLEQARVNLNEALTILTEGGDLHDQLDVVIGFAWLELRQGNVLQCAHIIGMIQAHPPEHLYPEREAYLKMVQPELEAKLRSAGLEHALTQGRNLNPDDVIQEILQRYSTFEDK